MPNISTQQSSWALLYNDFVLETDPAKLRVVLGTLEGAIFERLQALDGTADSQAEKLAIQKACRKLLQVKVEKLGFPPVDGESV